MNLSPDTWIVSLNHPDWWTRLQAERALHDLSGASLDALMALLSDLAQPNESRWRAAHALGVIRDARALPALTTALRDESSDVQYFAAWSLGRLGDPGSMDALTGVLHARKLEEQANFAAAMALVQIDRTRGLAALRQTLTSENEAARRVAYGALATLNAEI